MNTRYPGSFANISICRQASGGGIDAYPREAQPNPF